MRACKSANLVKWRMKQPTQNVRLKVEKLCSVSISKKKNLSNHSYSLFTLPTRTRQNCLVLCEHSKFTACWLTVELQASDKFKLFLLYQTVHYYNHHHHHHHHRHQSYILEPTVSILHKSL